MPAVFVSSGKIAGTSEEKKNQGVWRFDLLK